MDISFNQDGSIEGLATSETRDFLTKLGKVSEFGDSQVTLIFQNGDDSIYDVFDEHGHPCSVCDTVSNHFILKKSKSAESLICNPCRIEQLGVA